MEHSHERPRRSNTRRLYRIRAMVCVAAAIFALPALFAKAPADAQDAARTPATQRAATASGSAATTGSNRSSTATHSSTASKASKSTRPSKRAQRNAGDSQPDPAATPKDVAYKTMQTAPPVTAAPVVTAPPVTAAPVVTAPPVTAAPVVTAPPVTAAPPPTNSESGIASYYNDPHGGCAHKTLPFGTVIHITASNGRTATCVVDDRGPYGAGRILDLDEAIFTQLAPLGAGLVSVTATW